MNSINLDQLVALNDEIVAIVRSGVPLDRGLIRLGEEMPGRLGRLATEVGRRLERGESLSQVVAQTDGTFPPIYGAVVEAGIRSGRLAVALEGLSSAARRVVEMRRIIAVSLLYPLAVLVTAYLLFLFCVAHDFPVLIDSYHQFEVGDSRWVDWMTFVERTVSRFWYLPPLIAAMLILFCGLRSRHLPASSGSWYARFPVLGSMLRAGHLAAFAEILTLLVEQQVPLDEALVLAGNASGDRGLQESSHTLAQNLRRGQPIGTVASNRTGFPPLLAWVIGHSAHESETSSTLRQMAQSYRAQARWFGDWLLVYLPILLSVAIGGSATALLALSVLGPWFNLLFQLGQP